MAKKKNIDKQKVIELHSDSSIRNIWVDNLHLAIRDDDICVVRFSTNLPEGIFEQLRFVTNREQLKEFVNILCATLDYYPSKEKSSK